jgi:hypothetical protein
MEWSVAIQDFLFLWVWIEYWNSYWRILDLSTPATAFAQDDGSMSISVSQFASFLPYANFEYLSVKISVQNDKLFEWSETKRVFVI